MVNFWRQLKFLLWKCILVKKRQKLWLAVELIVPCILFIVIALVRTKNFEDAREQCHYDSKGMISAGLLPFIHSFFCSFSNKCNSAPTTGDEKEFLFNDNGNMTRNESIVVDFVYYSSLQLRWIGENKQEFEKVVKETAEIIHYLAKLNADDSNQLGIAKVNQFLDANAQESFLKTMDNLSVKRETSEKLLNATILPGILELSNYDVGFLIFLDNPLFCDEKLFNSSFSFAAGQELTKEERSELCNAFSASDYPNFMPVIGNATLPTNSGVKISDYWKSARAAFNPVFGFFGKYSDLSPQQFILAVFCGSDPKELSMTLKSIRYIPLTTQSKVLPDIIQEAMNPNKEVTVETPFNKMRKKVIDFIETVTPGSEEHQNGTCTPVTYHRDLNCSSLEGPLSPLRAILQGFILVTPENPATRRLVEKLNEPLRQVEYLRNFIFYYPYQADNLQNALHESDLWPASQTILELIKAGKVKVPPTVVFVLENLFANSSDPNSFGALTKSVAQVASKYASCFYVDRFRFVADERTLEKNALCLMQEKQYFSGITFEMGENAEEFDEFTTYKIRHNPKLVDSTNSFMDSNSNPFTRNRPFSDLKYITYGFSFLQEAIDRAIIEEKSNGTTSSPIGVYAQQEPFPCITKDTFNVALFMPLFLLISFIFPSALLVKNIVYEKELRIKEQMRSMGLGDVVHFVSWALISLVLNFFSVLVIAAISKLARIFNNTDFTLLLFVLVLFLFSSIAMSIFFSTLFNNANIGTAATCILWFVFFTPFQLKMDSIKTPTFNRICLLLPPTAVGHTFKLLESYNAIEKATWSDVPEMVNPVYGLSVEMCMIMLVVDTFLYLIFAWYISAVAPGEFGVSQPLYFPFTIKYWFPNFDSRNRVEFFDEQNFDVIQTGDSFDAEPVGVKLTIHINSMSKVYDNGTKALNNLNLRLYENQITGLLGHNGAGKTTTMSILCGLYAPTSGTAKIYSRDIRTDLRRVREVLGICPQHNVLFTHLTVAEQLRLFAALKGVKDEDLDGHVREILESVSLTAKANKLASTLSGGMKRRLCIGIAFIGGSKFVILDEPTAGVDVTARKEIWRLLQRNKQGRTILLSTHHMDEADVLSDRIAILSQGECIAVGSSVFLKRRFGNFMSLIIVKKQMENMEVDYEKIKDVIAEMGAGIGLKFDDENEEEIVFKIPIQTDSEKLEAFFIKLDENLELYKFGEYGISAPTLQSIFVSLAPQKEYHVPKVSKWAWLKKLKSKICRTSAGEEEETSDLIAENGNNQNHQQINNEIEEVKIEDFEKPDLIKGKALHWQHFLALVECRWIYRLRNKKIFLFQVILPLLLLVLCEMYVVVQVPSNRPDMVVSQEKLPLTTEIFGNRSDFYVNNWQPGNGSVSSQVLRKMLESPGTGPRCATGHRKDAMSKILLDLFSRNNYGWGRHRPQGGIEKDVIENAYKCRNIQGKFDYEEDILNITYNSDIPCACEEFGWNCTLEDWKWEQTNWLRLNTTDRVFDVSGRNLSEFRMITKGQQIPNNTAPFFLGGFSMGHINRRAQNSQEIEYSKEGWVQLEKDFSMAETIINLNTSNLDPPDQERVEDPFSKNVTMSQVVNGILDNLEKRDNIKVWFNNKIWPSFPIVSNVLTNGLLRMEDEGEKADNLGLMVFNHPMNETVEDSLSMSATAFAQALSLFRITCLLMVLSMIPAGFTVYLVEDRVCEALHLQMVGGLRKTTYWVTSYLYDMTFYILIICAILFIYCIFGVEDFTETPSTTFAFFLTFLVYGMCAVLYAYVFQKKFDIAALSFVVISIGCYFLGVVCALTVILMENLMQLDPTLIPAHTVCSIVFLILPQYNLGLAIFRGTMVYQVKSMGVKYLKSINRPDLVNDLPLPALLEFDMMGLHIFCLFLHFILAAGCLIFSQMDEFAFMRAKEREVTKQMMQRDQTNDEDEDVLREKRRVAEIAESNGNALVVRDLAKCYGMEHLAVKGISFAVEAGECFGLLGLNGAGKTTTFSMLTTKIWPGNGVIEMGEARISAEESSGKDAFQNLGYCPQFDALNMKLTTKENLKFFAKIRGIVPAQIDPIVERLLVALHLRPYSDTQTSSLSGGNRRKLSVAVALISQPSLVFLDEPSAGMDPGSQQFLWKVIERLCKSGKAVVLTSHSMEECEALCTRIAIMDKGRIRCLGGKQHLKNKFGNGTMLTIKLTKPDDAMQVAEKVSNQLIGSTVEAIHCSTIFVRIEYGTSSVAKTLQVVNTATLDNVFQSIAERQEGVIQPEIPPVVVLPESRDDVYAAPQQ